MPQPAEAEHHVRPFVGRGLHFERRAAVADHDLAREGETPGVDLARPGRIRGAQVLRRDQQAVGAAGKEIPANERVSVEPGQEGAERAARREQREPRTLDDGPPGNDQAPPLHATRYSPPCPQYPQNRDSGKRTGCRALRPRGPEGARQEEADQAFRPKTWLTASKFAFFAAPASDPLQARGIEAVEAGPVPIRIAEMAGQRAQIAQRAHELRQAGEFFRRNRTAPQARLAGQQSGDLLLVLFGLERAGAVDQRAGGFEQPGPPVEQTALQADERLDLGWPLEAWG